MHYIRMHISSHH